MKAESVRSHLTKTLEEVQAASRETAESSTEQQLTGIAKVLTVSEEPTMEPEAVVYPERGALDTIQRRLTTIIDETDEEAVADHLTRARRELLLVITTLDDQWNKQHGQ